MQENLCIALQKTGRLAEGSLYLLDKCGINIKIKNNQLLTQDNDFGLNFIFARDDDILGLIATHTCDLGVIGENVLVEYRHNNVETSDMLEVVMPLGFSKCRLSLAVPKAQRYQSLSDLNGKVIATSYPKTLSHFLNQNQIQAQIVTMHGSVELAPQIEIADLICDLVSSGATLSENGLHEFMQVLSSQAMLVRTKNTLSQHKQKLLDRLIMRINGVLYAKQNKYIMLHIDRDKLAALINILPGSESPTILELTGIPGKVAVHVVSLEEVFWETIEKLKGIGASSILVLPIEKMIF